MPRAKKISHSEWDSNKESIRALFIDRDKSHDELVNSMAEEHGFLASKAQYIRQLGKWNIKKYSTKENWKHADALVRKRKIDGKETEILMNGKLVSAKKLKKELGRYAWQQTYGHQSFVEDAPGGVIARTPPPSAMASTLGGTLPWFQFQHHLHSLMTPNPAMVPNLGTLRLDLSPAANNADMLLFANNILFTGSSIKSISEAISTMRGQMPHTPELDDTAQIGGLAPDLLSVALQWAIYRCTNNLLIPQQVDELLRFAITSGNLEALKEICHIPGPTTKILLSKLLLSAIGLRNLALTRFLLQHGANPEARHQGMGNPSALQIAARTHNAHAAQLLLNHGADPNGSFWWEKTPLFLALEKPGGSSIVNALVKAGADLYRPSHGWCHSTLMAAEISGDMRAVNLLIDAGEDVDFFSCSAGSALQNAAEACDLEMVQVLLYAGANPNVGAYSHISQRDDYRGSPLRLPLAAAVCRKTRISQCLTRSGLDIDVLFHKQTLMVHTIYSMTAFRAYLMKKLHANRNHNKSSHQEQQSQPPRQRQIIELFLQAGTDVNMLPPSGYGGCNETPMQAAARSGDLSMVNLFLYHGEDAIMHQLSQRSKPGCASARKRAAQTCIIFQLTLSERTTKRRGSIQIGQTIKSLTLAFLRSSLFLSFSFLHPCSIPRPLSYLVISFDMYIVCILVPISMLVSRSLATTVETHLTTTGPSLSAIRQDLKPGGKERYKRDDGDNLIGYFIMDGEISEYRCQNTDFWLGDTSVPWRRITYAHCSGRSAIPGDSPPIGTTCSGNTVFWANMDGRTLTGSSSRYCGKYSCITETVYDPYDDGSGSGPQYWIDCEENLRPPQNLREFYRIMPEPTARTSTESMSSTTELSAAGTTEASFSSSIASEIASETASESTTDATETPNPTSDKGLSSGTIAGIVIGSFFVGVLLTSTIAVLLMRRQLSVASQSENGTDGLRVGTVGGSQMELVSVDRRT